MNNHQNTNNFTKHYCTNCGAPLEPGRNFCGFCGAKHFPNPPKIIPTTSPTSPKSNKKLFIILGVIGLGFLIGVVLLSIFFVTPLIRYNQATTLMKEGSYDEAYEAFQHLADDYNIFDDNKIILLISQAEDLDDGTYHNLCPTLDLMATLNQDAIDMITYKHPVLEKAFALNGTWLYSGGWDSYNHEPLTLPYGYDHWEINNGEAWQYAPAKSYNYELYAMQINNKIEIFVSAPQDIKTFYWKIEGFSGEGDKEFVLHRFAKSGNHDWTMTYKLQ